MLRRSLSTLVSTIIVILVVIIGAIATYVVITSMSGKIASEKVSLAQIVLEAVSYPTSYEIVVSSTGPQPVLSQPIKLYVRNIGSETIRVDRIYIETPTGNVVLSYELPKPVAIPPKHVVVIELNITYEDYQKLASALYKYSSLEVALGTAAGVSTSVVLSSLPPPKLKLSSIVFNMYLVIIDCSDAAGWWVNIDQLIQDARNAMAKIKGLQVIIINSSYDLYYLFYNYTAIGYTPEGTPVRANLSGKRAIIVDAHGEVLPLPPQFVKDTDNNLDNGVEIAIKEYAELVRNALLNNPWYLVTVVGAPIYYVSNNGFSYDKSTYTLKFTYPNGTTVTVHANFDKVYSDRIAWSVATDAGETLEFQIRFGAGNPKLVTLDRRFVYFLITGNWNNEGPDWLSLEIKNEPRLAMNRKSWHNFANEYVVSWGGAAALKATEAVSKINSFFGASLPQTISAARAVPSNYPDWFNKVIDCLYETTDYSLISIAMLHYDDLSTNSIQNLDAGNGRNYPYWRIVFGNANIDTNAKKMILYSNTLVLRNVVGWADFGTDKTCNTYKYLISNLKATSVVYSFKLAASGSGYACIVLGNGTQNGLAVLNLSISNGHVTGIYLVNASISNSDLVPNPNAPNAIYRIAQGVSIPVSSLTSITITLSGNEITVSIGSKEYSSSWARSGVDLNYTLISPGFANKDLQSLEIGGPIKVFAKNVKLPAGKASAVLPVGEGKLILGGYSPPDGVVKEYGYTCSQVDTKYLADAAIYYPLYLVLKEQGVNIP